MSVIGLFFGRGANGFGHRSTAEDVTQGVDLSGKTFLLTGCNSGIGHETARVLALRGARVIGAARTLSKATDACADFGEHAIPIACELSDPASVRSAVQAVKQTGHGLDGILCNAGIMALPERTLHNGYEAQFFTNHVGHFMLVVPLLDQLTDTGRVVMTSSTGHTATYSEGIRLDDLSADKGYSAFRAYGQSKLANILFAKHLATRLEPGQTANAVHPGVIQTNLGRNMNVVMHPGSARRSALLQVHPPGRRHPDLRGRPPRRRRQDRPVLGGLQPEDAEPTRPGRRAGEGPVGQDRGDCERAGVGALRRRTQALRS